MQERTVRIGLLGCGYVGGGLCALLERVGDEIRARSRVRLAVERILVRDPAKPRQIGGAPLSIPPSRFTTEVARVLEDPRVDLVVEALGGVEPAAGHLERALRSGKPVVTANKAAFAERGRELLELAASLALPFGAEATVCGAVPVLALLQGALSGDRVSSLEGVVNATTNFILSRMEAGEGYAEALGEAQRAGYAEADPSLDVDGIDAAQKLAILSWAAFGAWLDWRRIPTASIRGLDPGAFLKARARGRVLRAVARAARSDDGVRASVGLLELDFHDPLAAVAGEQNALRVRAAGAGVLFFSGPGAGPLPTASALLGDIVRIASGRPPTLALPPEGGGDLCEARVGGE